MLAIGFIKKGFYMINSNCDRVMHMRIRKVERRKNGICKCSVSC